MENKKTKHTETGYEVADVTDDTEYIRKTKENRDVPKKKCQTARSRL